MKKPMSIASRRELLENTKTRYHEASWQDKGRILDGLIAVCGYDRKYVTRLMNTTHKFPSPQTQSLRRTIYDGHVKQALIFLWYAANQICSKRLVPFLPELLEVLERHGHLSLPGEVRERLLAISHATVDRLLQSERHKIHKSISTTRPGSLFKHQIKIRTFADWDNVVPGFMEVDLVAHCGGNTSGTFINTLVLVDISTTWLECIPLIRRSAGDVIGGLNVATDLLPFPLLGIDTDNGSEFINHDILQYCEEHHITFTRARRYKSNDQAHVEEKNGSVVRRLIGYDRFEGLEAWGALTQLYKVMRLYVNFFQPSMKLLSKERSNAKVTKKYHPAKTPYQRILLSEHIAPETKKKLTIQYKNLDPVSLLRQLERLQTKLWADFFTGQKSEKAISYKDVEVAAILDSTSKEKSEVSAETPCTIKRFYHRKAKTDLRSSPRNWRTRKDPFVDVWDEVRLQLELNPELSPKGILKELIDKYPGDFKPCHLRTLQRRVAEWHRVQQSYEDKLRDIMLNDELKKAPLQRLETLKDGA
jgi:hypothetical protein